VTGGASVGAASPASRLVASISSAPVGDLLAMMLLASDNETAEMLTREAGVRLRGLGSTAAGTTALAHALRDACAPLTDGGWGDGSGLSRDNRRSARELRRLVQFAMERPWWGALAERLPVAGRSGTLANRFTGTPAAGNARAKTGTIIGGASLTGVVTTAGGRQAVFSYLVNGDRSRAAIRALDELVVTLAADPT
jgi:D-alanyl-D-alanine carboxypeptidase/D-alanyl-D-alanine-endopeptidase (penicillin-binding protein 4)